MIIDTVLIRAGEVIVKHDSGQETGLTSVILHAGYMGDTRTLTTLCYRLEALAVEEHKHAGGSDDDT